MIRLLLAASLLAESAWGQLATVAPTEAEERALVDGLISLGKEFRSFDKLRELDVPAAVRGLRGNGDGFELPLPPQLEACLRDLNGIRVSGLLSYGVDRLLPGGPTSDLVKALSDRLAVVREVAPWQGPLDLELEPALGEGDPRQALRQANAAIVTAASAHGRYLALNADIVERAASLEVAAASLAENWRALEGTEQPSEIHAAVFQSEACAMEFAGTPAEAYEDIGRKYGAFLFYDAVETLLRGVSSPFAIVVPKGVPFCVSHDFGPECSPWQERIEDATCFSHTRVSAPRDGPIVGLPRRPADSLYPVLSTGCDQDLRAHLRPFYSIGADESTAVEPALAVVNGFREAVPEARGRFASAYSAHRDRFRPQLQALNDRLADERRMLDAWTAANGTEGQRLAAESAWLAQSARDLAAAKRKIADLAAEREQLERDIEAGFAHIASADAEWQRRARAVEEQSAVVEELVARCAGDAPACRDPAVRAEVNRRLYEAYAQLRDRNNGLTAARADLRKIRDEIRAKRARVAELREQMPALRERYTADSFARQARQDKYDAARALHEREVALHARLRGWYDDDTDLIRVVDGSLTRLP